MPYFKARALHPPVEVRLEDAGRHPPVAARRPFLCKTGQVQPDGTNGELVCSARGCRRQAAWALRWNNPRLHSPERRKTWLACDEHRPSLAEFLQLRSFLKETVPAASLDGSEDVE
jgi:hypothetical protein